jgi:hypothetical protein
MPVVEDAPYLIQAAIQANMAANTVLAVKDPIVESAIYYGDQGDPY